MILCYNYNQIREAFIAHSMGVGSLKAKARSDDP